LFVFVSLIVAHQHHGEHHDGEHHGEHHEEHHEEHHGEHHPNFRPMHEIHQPTFDQGPVEKFFSVKAVERENIDNDYRLFKFCIPFHEVPLGDKYHAVITFYFSSPVEKFGMRYGFKEEIDTFVHPDGMQSTLSFPLHSPNGNQFGWADNAFSVPFSGDVYVDEAELKGVTLKLFALWTAAEPSLAQCPAEFGDIVVLKTSLFEESDELTGFNPIVVVVMCSFFFFLSFLICLCCAATPEHEEHYVRPFAVEDEEQMIQFVQQQSLEEYQAQFSPQPCAPVMPPSTSPDQGYMRIPVMSPELYAQYLAAATQDIADSK